MPDTVVKLKQYNLPETSHNTFFENILKDALSSKLDGITTTLINNNIDSFTFLTKLELAIENKSLNKSVATKVKKYVEREDISVSNMLEVCELLYSFIHEIKSLSANMKYRQDILRLTLGSSLPDVAFMQYYKEGF